MIRHLVIAAASFALVVGAISLSLAQEPKESTEGLDMQAARAKMMSARGAKVAYTKKFDLSGLPQYEPKQKVSGTIRMWGSNYITDGFLGGYWEAAFKRYHPDVKFDFKMKTTLAAVPSLVFGVSDLSIGRKVTFAEQELFERYKDRPPIEIEIATGHDGRARPRARPELEAELHLARTHQRSHHRLDRNGPRSGIKCVLADEAAQLGPGRRQLRPSSWYRPRPSATARQPTRRACGRKPDSPSPSNIA